MRYFFSLLVLFFACVFSNSAQAQHSPPSWEWAQQVGGINSWQNYTGGIATGKSGHVYVSGYFTSPGTFGGLTITAPGSQAAFVARFRPNGSCVWVRPVEVSAISGIALDEAENWFITGTFSGTTAIGASTLISQGDIDVFVAKFDSSGQAIWAHSGGSFSTDDGGAVTTDQQGNCFIAGRNFGSAIYGTTPVGSGGFLIKYDPSGTLLWARNTTALSGYGLSSDMDGNCFITGIFTYTVSFGPGIVLYGGSETSMFVAKYNASGTALWANKAGGAGRANGIQVKADRQGNCILIGNLIDSVSFNSDTLLIGNSWDGFVARYSPSGSLQWVRKVGGTYWDMARALAIDSAGNSYVTGHYYLDASFGALALSSAGSDDAFVIKLNQAGEVIWAIRAGGSAEDWGNGIAVDTAGNAYISGKSYYSPSFGGSTLTGYMVAYFAKLKGTNIISASSLQIGESQLRVWPNPFANQLSLQLGTGGAADAVIRITDITGREVYAAILPVRGQELQLQLPGTLQSGLYLLSCTRGSHTARVRVVKQ